MSSTLKATLPDGRVVEAVEFKWADAAPDDSPNGLPVNITVVIDDTDVRVCRVFLTDDEMRKAFDAAD